jgi:hypothetical protein
MCFVPVGRKVKVGQTINKSRQIDELCKKWNDSKGHLTRKDKTFFDKFVAESNIVFITVNGNKQAVPF